MSRAVIARRQRKDQSVDVARLLVEQIEKSFLRTYQIEPESPSVLKNLTPRRLKCLLIGLPIAILLDSQAIAQTAFWRKGGRLCWRIGRQVGWRQAQPLPCCNTENDQTNQSADQQASRAL